MIGAGVAVAGSVIGGLMGGSAAKKQAKAQAKLSRNQIDHQERLHEEGAAERERYSQTARADQTIATGNLLASEQARMQVRSALGSPGTYGGSSSGGLNLGVLQPSGLRGMGDTSGQGGFGMQTQGGNVTREDAAAIAKRGGGMWKGTKSWETEGADLDANEIAQGVMSGSGFRAVSGMVAEAEQLQNREGPMWDQLNNSIVGGIYESAAAGQREMMENVAINMAKGGSARRQGLQVAQAMQVQEKVNRVRTGELWKSKSQLEKFRTDQVQRINSFADDWVGNQAGIRDEFSGALNNLQMHWSETMAPGLTAASVNAQSATQSGVANASQGLLDAIKVKHQGMSGALEGIIGAATNFAGAAASKYGGSSGGSSSSLSGIDTSFSNFNTNPSSGMFGVK
tara:strand:+ start:8998 stop:10191 length:1194 start_codon:yes stop_codon:yes gene_type:complete